MPTSRRRFIRDTLGSTTLLSVGLSVPHLLVRTAAAAASAKHRSERILVVLQLSGGNDGLNTVVPYADVEYLKHRIALRIAADQALKIDDHVGLHPQMTGVRELVEQKRFAIVQGVGYPNPDRSHFRSMDIWHSAQPQLEQPRDGWLGRSLEAKEGSTSATNGGDVPALHLGGNRLPLALASRSVAVPSIESTDRFRLRTSDGAIPLDSLRSLAVAPRQNEPPLLDFLRRGTLNAYASSEQVQQALTEPETATKYPTQHNLARKLRTIAQLIDAGLSTRIYYVSLDGFDTHANQAGTHANLLKEYSDSLSAFVADLAERGHLDRVVVLTFSEFGRRVHENASQGTDHGAAAPVFLAGGAVKSGVIGKHPSLSDLDAEGDLKFHADFRRVYATLLDKWLGCSSESVLAARHEPLELLAVG